jgi:flagellar biosynthesis regulator FlbT
MGNSFSERFARRIKIIMKILKTKSIASVELAEVEISIDELQVFEAALNYATKTLNDAEIERIFGASKDELEGIIEDVEKTSMTCKERNLEPALA